MITQKIIWKLAKNLRQLNQNVQLRLLRKPDPLLIWRFYNRWRMFLKPIKTLLPTLKDLRNLLKNWWNMLLPKPLVKMSLIFMPICNIKEIKLAYQGRDRSALLNQLFKQLEVTSQCEQTKMKSWALSMENQQSNFTPQLTQTTLIKNEFRPFFELNFLRRNFNFI